MRKIYNGCNEEGCQGQYYASGYCRSHYNTNYVGPIVNEKKKCSACKEWLLLDLFGGIKKPNPNCSACHREISNKRYYENPEKVKEQNNKSRIKRRDDNRKHIIDYFLEHPCLDCGETDPVVLEFDHVVGKKMSAVCQLVAASSWKKVLSEIAKCVVRCANCHRRKTHNQFGWWGSEKEVL